MYSVYANLLGKWTKLDDSYSIAGLTLEDFITEFLPKSDNTIINNNFVRIIHNNEEHYLHISQIQWTN